MREGTNNCPQMIHHHHISPYQPNNYYIGVHELTNQPIFRIPSFTRFVFPCLFLPFPHLNKYLKLKNNNLTYIEKPTTM